MTSSGRTSLPSRLTAIDETTRADHYYLAEGDWCFCFGEYFADQGWGHSPTNQLIFNYKCKPNEKSARLYWKEQAIATIAAGLKGAIARQEVERHTWDRVPPCSIILFDDVLTTGKHFKACERRLREIDPTIAIAGVFVARRALPRPIDDFENLDSI
jgi:hypothetical protein